MGLSSNIISNSHISINNYQSMDISEQDGCDCWWNYLTMLCFIVGFIRLARILVAFMRPFLNRRANLFKRYGGGWALITGGSEGIGYSIAQQLAKQKFHIILVSRSLSKLKTASQNLKKAYPTIQIITKSIDFEKITTKQQYQQSFSQLMEKDISVLVNNVGYYLPYNFASVTFEEIRRQLKINCLPIAVLSKMFLQKMRKRQFRSGMINLSSASSTTAYKGAENYSATKTFDDYLSQTLAYENSDKIDILTARPFIVTSTMTRNVDSFINTTCDKSAKAIVDSLSNRKIVYGPFIHNIQSLGPQFIFSPIVQKIFAKGQQDFRNSYDKQS